MSCDSELQLDVLRGDSLSFWIFPEEPNGDPMDLDGFTAAGAIQDEDNIDSETTLLVTLTGAITAPPLTGTAATRATEAGLSAAELLTFYAVQFTAAASLTDKTVTAIDTAVTTSPPIQPYWQGRATNGATKKPLGRGPVVFKNDLI